MTIKVLLTSNLDIEMNNPLFRKGAYEVYLAAAAEALERTKEFECRFLISEVVFGSLTEGRVTADKAIVVGQETLYRRRLQNFLINSYEGADGGQLKEAEDFIAGILGKNGFVPDVVLCWETPTRVFRELYPEALTIDLMPGFVSRPPYPRTISIDPCGLYKDCWYSPDNLKELEVSDGQREEYAAIRETYEKFFRELGDRDVLQRRDPRKKLSLVPLQISGYFGFRDNCAFASQYEFLRDAVLNARDETMIVTQYTGGAVKNLELDEANVAYLNGLNGNVIVFEDRFNKIDTVSQFFITLTDKVYSVSSTMGIQAVFYGKELVSPSRSHLKYLAAGNDPAKVEDVMVTLLTRGTLLLGRIADEKDYFAAVVKNMLQKKAAGLTGSDLLPDAAVADNTRAAFAARSAFPAALRNYNKLSPDKELSRYKEREAYLRSIFSENVKYVSFDIFDTLVKRTVGNPADVFLIMQETLRRRPEVPGELSREFAKLRVMAERMTRRERDAELAAGEEVSEEITVSEIYAKIAALLGEDLDAAPYIKLEEEVEEALIVPRRLGRFLFDCALNTGKQVIITSDFCHGEDFIRRILAKCGYAGFSALYLSSARGLKKHTGSLFVKILDDLKIDPAELLHIGDNPTGDVKVPRDLNIRAMRVPRDGELANAALTARQLNFRDAWSSAYLRAALSVYGDCFYPGGEARAIIANKIEYGFLAVGPLMYNFARFVLDYRRKNGYEQLVFFARDCRLPYLAARLIREKEGCGPEPRYIHVSRKSLAGVEIFEPRDALNVRIDDYNKTLSLASLLTVRFLIPESMIGEDALERCGVAGAGTAVGEIESEVIYSLVLDILTENWEEMSAVYERKRAFLTEYLRGEGVDVSAKTLCVDIGYKGSIHKKLAAVFAQKIGAVLFMSYAGDAGGDPLEDAAVFYRADCAPRLSPDPLIKYNLLFETVINESVGTAKEIIRTVEADGTAKYRAIFEQNLPRAHLDDIAEIHRGAVMFFEKWLEIENPFLDLIVPEKEALVGFFGEICRNPTASDLKIFENLVFDNPYSTDNTIRILHRNAEEFPRSRNLWPEGNQAKKAGAGKNSAAKGGPKSPADGSAAFLTLGDGTPAVRNNLWYKGAALYAKHCLGGRKYDKFRRAPAAFFEDSRSPFVRFVGRRIIARGPAQ